MLDMLKPFRMDVTEYKWIKIVSSRDLSFAIEERATETAENVSETQDFLSYERKDLEQFLPSICDTGSTDATGRELSNRDLTATPLRYLETIVTANSMANPI